MYDNEYDDEYKVTSYNHDVSYYQNIGLSAEKGLKRILMPLLILGACCAGIGKFTYHTSIEEKQTTFTINKMEVKTGRYLLFTDKGVFENTDSIFKKKYNSSDMYNELQVGKTYDVITVGPRNHFLSWYPNVIKAKLKENSRK